MSVAAVVAYGAHRWFYVLLLYAFLIGMTGGLMAWMVLDEVDPDRQGTRLMAVAGVAAAAVAYLLYEYLLYRFDVAGFEPRPGWWSYLTETAQGGATFGRLGRTSSIDLGAWFVWSTRVLEFGIAMACGAGVARSVNFRR